MDREDGGREEEKKIEGKKWKEDKKKMEKKIVGNLYKSAGNDKNSR